MDVILSASIWSQPETTPPAILMKSLDVAIGYVLHLMTAKLVVNLLSTINALKG
jgi:hypothetical protein